MKVVLTAGVEGCVTNHTLKTTLQVLLNGQFGAAGAAENRLVAPFTLRPNLYRMAGQSRVAVFAGVKRAATPHLDGDDVGWAVIMLATSLRIEIQTSHFRRSLGHISIIHCGSADRERLYMEPSLQTFSIHPPCEPEPFLAASFRQFGHKQSR